MVLTGAARFVQADSPVVLESEGPPATNVVLPDDEVSQGAPVDPGPANTAEEMLGFAGVVVEALVSAPLVGVLVEARVVESSAFVGDCRAAVALAGKVDRGRPVGQEPPKAASR